MKKNNDRIMFLVGRATKMGSCTDIIKIWQSKLILVLVSMFVMNQVMAANPDGDLRIEAFNAPNFVVDSNIETPATYGPRAVHLGAQFCNNLLHYYLVAPHFEPRSGEDAGRSKCQR